MKNILLVDDNDVVRGLAREMLENAGYPVVEAAGLSEALSLAREGERIDILITDLVMPDGDGLELAASIGLLYPFIRVLHTSAYADMRWTGSFVAKPFTSAELIGALDELIAA
jgi:CheY-like chemotaxis protein